MNRLISNEDHRYEERDIPEVYPSNEVTIIAVRGAEFYADVPTLDDNLPGKQGVTNAVVIFRLRGREGAGSTFLKWLEKYAQGLQADGNLLMLAGISPDLKTLLEHTGAIDIVGRENVFLAQPGLGASLDAAREAAEKWLSTQKAAAS